MPIQRNRHQIKPFPLTFDMCIRNYFTRALNKELVLVEVQLEKTKTDWNLKALCFRKRHDKRKVNTFKCIHNHKIINIRNFCCQRRGERQGWRRGEDYKNKGMCQSQAAFMIQILYEDYRKLIGHTMPKCSIGRWHENAIRKDRFQ